MLELRNINFSNISDLEAELVNGEKQALWTRHPRIREESNLRHVDTIKVFDFFLNHAITSTLLASHQLRNDLVKCTLYTSHRGYA